MNEFNPREHHENLVSELDDLGTQVEELKTEVSGAYSEYRRLNDEYHSAESLLEEKQDELVNLNSEYLAKKNELDFFMGS